MLNIVLAINIDYGISYKNTIPWKVPEDLHHFKIITTNGIVIMGRKTADTLKNTLSNRINIVLSKSRYSREGFISFTDLLDSIEWSIKNHWDKKIFIIGGSQIITETLKYPRLIDNIYITDIHGTTMCDNFVKDLQYFVECKCNLANRTVTDKCTYNIYQPKKSTGIGTGTVTGTGTGTGTGTEQDYLNIMLELLKAKPRQTRNAITKSLFSAHLTFDLSDGFPLLTTKRVFWKGIVNELLFFLGGCTDNKWLQNRGVHIWDANTSKDNKGDLGPMYGYQFRHFGATYKGKDYDYTGQGMDQFAEVIDLLKNDPHSRRILMTTYNYMQVKEGVLYPCHGTVIQFYVRDDFIDLQMYQRSSDWLLGCPFNIASYALLLEIVVNILGGNFKAGRLYITFGDCHLYDTHIRAAIVQLSREPKGYPKLKIKQRIENIEPKYFLQLDPDIFELEDYNPDAGIKAKMIV